ncbi:CAP domain-containing protein [Oscillibacter sp.]|uniref:CAP domain-containing protein n=1 Tax=Oscillibacter sp. TaxID=1945593 RepID=UPI00289B87C8|nr:CAP domain-containing protein [Oscillibacter sp.]
MKNLKKTLSVALTSAILAVGLAVSASAQTLPGASCPSGSGRSAAFQNVNNVLSTYVNNSSNSNCSSNLKSLLGNLTSNGSGQTLPSSVSDLLKQCGIDSNVLNSGSNCNQSKNSNSNSNCNSNTNCNSNSNCNSNTNCTQAGNCITDCDTTGNCTTTCDKSGNCTQPTGNNQTPSTGNGQSGQNGSSNQGGSGSTDNSTADNQTFEQQVADLVNQQRAANGLNPLTLSTELSAAARAKSQDMHDKNYFAHESPTYGSPFDMLKTFGISYRTAGENIAMGYSTPEAVMNAWMNSSGHRANILNASYTQIGVGYVADGNYWTQEFIG